MQPLAALDPLAGVRTRTCKQRKRLRRRSQESQRPTVAERLSQAETETSLAKAPELDVLLRGHNWRLRRMLMQRSGR